MNYAPCLNTAICTCGNEISNDSEHALCLGCRVDLALAIEAERAADFRALAHEALVTRIVASAQARALAMYSTTYSISGYLDV